MKIARVVLCAALLVPLTSCAVLRRIRVEIDSTFFLPGKPEQAGRPLPDFAVSYRTQF